MKCCDFLPELHHCWARGIHECWGPPTHQHWPKRSQGGKRVVAILCLGLHDSIDNGFRYQGRRWANDVEDGQYRIRDRETGETLLTVPIGGSDGR